MVQVRRVLEEDCACAAVACAFYPDGWVLNGYAGGPLKIVKPNKGGKIMALHHRAVPICGTCREIGEGQSHPFEEAVPFECGVAIRIDNIYVEGVEVFTFGNGEHRELIVVGPYHVLHRV